jgi:hypothetical protein
MKKQIFEKHSGSLNGTIVATPRESKGTYSVVCDVDGTIGSYTDKESAEYAADRHLGKYPNHQLEVVESH